MNSSRQNRPANDPGPHTGHSRAANSVENSRIIVIDDNLQIHEDYRKTLCPANRADDLAEAERSLFGDAVSTGTPADVVYQVDFAENGRDGLDTVSRALAAGKPYALAFVDMQMPGWSGVETIQHLWQVDRSLQVVICSGSSDKSWKRVLAKLGQNDQLLFLRKPFDVEEVKRLASALTAKWVMTERARERVDLLEESVRQKTRDIRVAHEDTIHRLVTASMYRDKETGAHIRRTGLFAEVIARELGWSEPNVEIIRMAAPMHDVGKIGIPDSILLKPAGLTRAEFEIMKTHTIIGAEMLGESLSPILQAGAQIALTHHERWDGSGYPHGTAGTDIPKAGRILAIIDVFDALSQDRTYRRALPEDEVIRRMREGSGSHFDPNLLERFFDVLPQIRAIARENPDPVSHDPHEFEVANPGPDIRAHEPQLAEQPGSPCGSVTTTPSHTEYQCAGGR